MAATYNVLKSQTCAAQTPIVCDKVHLPTRAKVSIKTLFQLTFVLTTTRFDHCALKVRFARRLH